MSDLHAAIAAALDREQAQHRRGLAYDAIDVCVDCHKPWPCLPWRVVEADRRVLARHRSTLGSRFGCLCVCCGTKVHCGDILDLAARVDVQP